MTKVMVMKQSQLEASIIAWQMEEPATLMLSIRVDLWHQLVKLEGRCSVS